MFDDAVALLKGFWTTFRNTPSGQRSRSSVPGTSSAARTDKYRGRHRVVHRTDDGLERCIGCSPARRPPVPGDLRGRCRERHGQPGSRPASASRRSTINMIRCIFCGFCEEACPADAIKLGLGMKYVDFNKKDFVYTKEMLLDPATFAPKLQYHADVDRSTDSRGVHTHARRRLSNAPPDRGAGTRATGHRMVTSTVPRRRTRLPPHPLSPTSKESEHHPLSRPFTKRGASRAFSKPNFIPFGPPRVARR